MTLRAVAFQVSSIVSTTGFMTDDYLAWMPAAQVTIFLLFFIGGMAISRIEGLPLRSCLFETASALGTVGLSLGITTRIGTVSRLILVVLMFLGRAGGLTLIYAAQSVRKSTKCTLPLEKVTVG